MSAIILRMPPEAQRRKYAELLARDRELSRTQAELSSVLKSLSETLERVEQARTQCSGDLRAARKELASAKGYMEKGDVA